MSDTTPPDPTQAYQNPDDAGASPPGQEPDLLARTQAELALMKDLHPILTRRAGGREISGLSAYEQ